jgi:cytoskeletal protein CcmA (bactofilin family)
LFKKDNLETPPDKVNTIIGKETVFKGTVHGKGLIRIDGTAEGSIINKGDIIIGESGKAAVELKARNITIAGHYEGTLEAEGRLEFKRTATASGTFKTNGLLIEEGAVLCGSMEMKLKDQSSATKTKYDFGYKADEPEKSGKPDTV